MFGVAILNPILDVSHLNLAELLVFIAKSKNFIHFSCNEKGLYLYGTEHFDVNQTKMKTLFNLINQTFDFTYQKHQSGLGFWLHDRIIFRLRANANCSIDNRQELTCSMLVLTEECEDYQKTKDYITVCQEKKQLNHCLVDGIKAQKIKI